MLWSEKYRPKSQEQIVGQNSFRALLRNCHHGLPNLLLYGPSGTGKSSSVNVLVHTLYGHNTRGNILRINASDSRGIGSIRDVISEFTRTGNAISLGASRVKLVILEEADSLTLDAQCCLRRIMELNCTSARFCLVCNFADKLLPAIRSRCSNFRFSPLSHADIISHLTSVALAENVPASGAALASIVHCAHGDLRCAINQLQTVASLDTPQIGPEHVAAAAAVPEQSFVDNLRVCRAKSFRETCDYLLDATAQCRMTSATLLRALYDGLRDDLSPEQLAHLADLQVVASMDHDSELFAIAAAAITQMPPRIAR